MIVCRRPWVIYDVDLVGAAAVTVLLAAAGWFMTTRWQQTWKTYNELSLAYAVSETKLHEDLLRVERFEQKLQPLAGVVDSQGDRAPGAHSLPKLLRKMAEVAAESGLELLSVEPQPAETSGEYLVSDIHLEARGMSRDFIRYLDRLAQENPYQALESCSIVRRAENAEPGCELAWTVRVYLLPGEPDESEGGSS